MGVLGRSLLVIVVGVCSVAALARSPRDLPATEGHLSPLLPRKELLLAVGAAYRHLLADYYWVRATHRTGTAQTPEEYLDVYYYGDLVTDLDPDFAYAYLFTGAVVPTNLGRETWRNTRESTRILEKGFARFPNIIPLRIHLAYNWSYFHKDYLKAAKLLEDTARLAGCPPHVPALATRLYAQAGHVDLGKAFAQTLIETAPDDETRQAFERRLVELELEGQLQELDRKIAAYRQREGQLPKTLHELVASGDLIALPSDPLGGTIFIGEDGRAYATSLKGRLETHRFPGEER